MPIYEYQCQSCQHQLEALQKMSADPLLDCPACGEEELKKKVSAATFRLKGGGWYETDFKTGDKKNLASAGGKESVDSKSDSSAGKSDSSAGKSDSSAGKSDSSAGKSDSGAGKGDSSAGATPAKTSAAPT